MVSRTPPRALPVVGGHLALDFANTVDNPLGPTRHDHLGDYDDLLAWSERAGTLVTGSPRPRKPGEVLGRAHELRDVLNDVFGAAADRTGDVAERWPALRPFVARAIAAAALDDQMRWSWPIRDDPAAMLHPVAVAAAELLTGPDLRLVKRCSGCPWLFVDRSRNHSRRWCDMADCGTVEKMQRYVSRRRERS